MKKEFLIYILTTVILSFIYHNKQLLNNPSALIINLQEGTIFNIPNILHPFIFGFIAYIVLYLIRYPFRRKKKYI